MHEAFSMYVMNGQALAEQRGLNWNMAVDEAGNADPGWNLTEIASARPPNMLLRDFGADVRTLGHLNATALSEGRPLSEKKPLSHHWQDLLKAAACEQLLFRRNSPGHVAQNIIRPLKVLGTCAGSLEPWELTADLVNEAVVVAKALQSSGKLGDLVLGAVKSVIDANHIAQIGPLYPSLLVPRLPNTHSRKSRALKSRDELLNDLDQRKRAERLPERRAFWELIRIVFTERPRSFGDAIRFCALKVMVITGLRIGEVVMLPADWKRTRDYYDTNGRPAGELGGHSRALLLRHFAEKQQLMTSAGPMLYETAQYIPRIFEEILTETLDEAVRLTTPLRDTLRRQVQSGRLLPWYAENELVSVIELYVRLTGNPFWLKLPPETAEEFILRYRENFDPAVLAQLDGYQSDLFRAPAIKGKKLDSALYVFFKRLMAQPSAPALRHASGALYEEPRIAWGAVYLHVGELERYLQESLPTKLPDRTPLRLETGSIQSWELLFLTPKRSLAEERNDGICDLTRCYSVGMPESFMLGSVLGEERERRTTLFERYCTTDEDRKLTLNSHSLRHLQNTELFRLGVADTIITKRFNRRSVAQSYEYDHRSLAEELDSVELPPELEAQLGSKVSTVARLIKTGKATGPLVATFHRIQQSQGEDAAFDFLKAEADGFHATPYGHCINSFTVDPCPKNLECFAGCRHLTATDLPENRRHLAALQGRLEAAVAHAQARPEGAIGRSNQLQHATIRLESVRKLLKTPTGQRVFPDGPDFSRPDKLRSVLDD